jgi:hypothetical protein
MLKNKIEYPLFIDLPKTALTDCLILNMIKAKPLLYLICFVAILSNHYEPAASSSSFFFFLKAFSLARA